MLLVEVQWQPEWPTAKRDKPRKRKRVSARQRRNERKRSRAKLTQHKTAKGQ